MLNVDRLITIEGSPSIKQLSNSVYLHSDGFNVHKWILLVEASY